MKYFCANKNTKNIGIVNNIVTAPISLKKTLNSLISLAIANGIVCCSSVCIKTRAKGNSLQLIRKAKMAVVINPILDYGKTTFIKAVNWLHPSTNADSSISRGIASKFPIANHVVKGTAKAVYKRIRPVCVFVSPMFSIKTAIGTSSAGPGNICPTKIIRSRINLYGNLYLANP